MKKEILPGFRIKCGMTTLLSSSKEHPLSSSKAHPLSSSKSFIEDPVTCHPRPLSLSFPRKRESSVYFFVIFIFCNSWNQLLRNPVFFPFSLFLPTWTCNIFFFLIQEKEILPGFRIKCGMTTLLSSPTWLGIQTIFYKYYKKRIYEVPPKN